jgi:hypothetical protein
MGTFKYHGPLPPDSSLFRGRTAELEHLHQLCQRDVEHYPIVYGGRQTGKTSLLSRLSTRLSLQTLVCSVDFQHISGASTAEACVYIAREVSHSLPGLVDIPNIQDTHALSRFLGKIIEQSQRKYVLLIEELGALPQTVREDIANFLRANFTNRFNPHYQPFQRLMVIIAGSLELYNLAVIDVSPLNNICDPIYLPDLTEEDATELIRDVLTEKGVAHEQAMMVGQAVYAHTNGHPYLTQRIGSILEDQYTANGSLTPSHVEQAVTHVLHQNDPLLSHLYHSLEAEPRLQQEWTNLVQGTVRFSRMDKKMVQLELLGLATERNGFWQVRNQLFAQALHLWFSHETVSHQPPPTGEQEDIPDAHSHEANEHTLRVFLCHADIDKPTVRTLYHQLRANGIDPWFDEESLAAGEHWQDEIARAVKTTDAVLICLSKEATAQTSHFHKQIKLALDVADEHPERSIFIILVKLEECPVPSRLEHLYPVSLADDTGYDPLLRSLQRRAQALGKTLSPIAEQPTNQGGGSQASTASQLPAPLAQVVSHTHQQAQSSMRQLSPTDFNQLIDLLMDCPSMQDQSFRNDVVKFLPGDVQSAIDRRSAKKPDVINIVRTCQNYPGGMNALREAIRTFNEGMHCMRNLDDFWKKYQ